MTREELRYKIAYEIQKMRSFNETADAILSLAGKEVVRVVENDRKVTVFDNNMVPVDRLLPAIRELFGVKES